MLHAQEAVRLIGDSPCENIPRFSFGTRCMLSDIHPLPRRSTMVLFIRYISLVPLSSRPHFCKPTSQSSQSQEAVALFIGA